MLKRKIIRIILLHLKGEDNANGEKAQQISERILKEMELI